MNGREAVGRLQKHLSGAVGPVQSAEEVQMGGLGPARRPAPAGLAAGKENQAETAAETPQTFDLTATEARLAEALSQIRGAGR